MEIHEKATNQELNFEKLRSSINLCCEVCLWDTSDAMMEPDKEITYWFFFNFDKDVCGRKRQRGSCRQKRSGQACLAIEWRFL